MTEEETQKLFNDFPNLYRGKNLPITQCLMAFGFECDSGWFTLLYELSEKLESLILKISEDQRHLYYVQQVKEKFGELRFYMFYETDEMLKLIDEAEKKSSEICEVCGQKGSLDSNRGWYQTLCETHRRK